MCWNGFFMFSIDLQGICSQYAVFLSMRVILCESVDVCVWTTRSVVSIKKEWVCLQNLAMAPKCLNDSRFLMFVVETNSIKITRWDQGNVINAQGREYSAQCRSFFYLCYLSSFLSYTTAQLADCDHGPPQLPQRNSWLTWVIKADSRYCSSQAPWSYGFLGQQWRTLSWDGMTLTEHYVVFTLKKERQMADNYCLLSLKEKKCPHFKN